MTKRDLALDLFRSYKTGYIKKRKTIRENHEKLGDPQLISQTLSSLIQERDWENGIAEGSLFSNWEEIVGEEIAHHTKPLSLNNGALLIQCSSTAWATQLTMVAVDLLHTIKTSAPSATVETLSFLGPQGPSWKKGIRTIRGARGPRDTYG